MMDELEPLAPELKALLEAEKPITGAPSAAKARLLAKLSSELFDLPGGDGEHGGEGGDGGGAPEGGPSGVGSGGASTASAGATGAGAATATVKAGAGAAAAGTGVSGAAGGLIAKAVVVKLVVGASAASLAVGGLIGAGVQSVVTAPPRDVSVAAQAPRDAAPPLPAPVEPSPPPPPSTPPPALPAPEPSKSAPGAPQRLTADEALSLEKSYLEQARAAMARQDMDAALAALAQHQRRFPKGQLTEERLALEVMALSSAGRSIEARNAAAEFRRRFPNGLFRTVVDTASPP